MTCDATKEALRLAAEWTRYQFGDKYVRDGFPTRVTPCDDYARGRAAGIEEAAQAAFDHWDNGGPPAECHKAIEALASTEYIGVRRADLESLLDLHDGEPLGLARDAYDRLRAAARRGRG